MVDFDHFGHFGAPKRRPLFPTDQKTETYSKNWKNHKDFPSLKYDLSWSSLTMRSLGMKFQTGPTLEPGQGPGYGTTLAKKWSFLTIFGTFLSNFSIFGKFHPQVGWFCAIFSQKICDTRKKVEKSEKFSLFFCTFFRAFRWNGCTFRDMGAWKALQRCFLASMADPRPLAWDRPGANFDVLVAPF